MPTGAYSTAFDENFFVGLGTTASTAPTSSSGLTRVTSLIEVPLKGTSETTPAELDFDSSLGFDSKLVRSNAYSIPASLNLDPSSASYRIIKNAWTSSTAGTTLRWFRQSPPVGGTASTAGEINSGVVFVNGLDETRKAGDVVKISFTLEGYGAPFYAFQGNPLATVTVTTAGSGLSPATYTAVPLINVTRGGGIGAIATVVVAAGGTVTAAPTITTAGTHYKVGDIMTVDMSLIGGSGSDVAPTFTVATVTT